jgi:hypothetical protein
MGDLVVRTLEKDVSARLVALRRPNFGVRGHVRALKSGDVSPQSKVPRDRTHLTHLTYLTDSTI